MMRVKRALSHKPTADWPCYTEDGREAADRSNLAYLYGGGNGPTAVRRYIEDSGVPSMGHRRWILFPRLRQIGTGDVPSAVDAPSTNVLWVVGDEFAPAIPQAVLASGVAWPPRGHVPWSEWVALPQDVWTFALPELDVDFASAVVTVRNDAGRELAITTPTHIASDVISWSIQSEASEWSRAPADTRFSVSVTNVRVGTEIRRYDYEVIFVTP